jgi:pimeloyl-ACP methyl ester carboxylesterase
MTQDATVRPPEAGARCTRRAALRGLAGGTALTVAGLATVRSRSFAFAQGDAMSSATPSPVATTPTVVLVHGAFADSSSWSGVLPLLQQAGLSVIALPNPLRSLSGDAAYVASAVSQVPGPVVLVGHSYGGAVITDAASQATNVVGLVYVAAFIPDAGEALQALAAQATDSLLGPALRPQQYPNGPGGQPGVEFWIDRASFHDAFCADLPDAQAQIMAITQRPAADLAFGEPTVDPAWKKLPSWAVVATADQAIGVTGSRLMAQRSGAITTEIDASHVVMLSQPAAVADVIRAAVNSVA